jgi:hypothetical protein
MLKNNASFDLELKLNTTSTIAEQWNIRSGSSHNNSL